MCCSFNIVTYRMTYISTIKTSVFPHILVNIQYNRDMSANAYLRVHLVHSGAGFLYETNQLYCSKKIIVNDFTCSVLTIYVEQSE